VATKDELVAAKCQVVLVSFSPKEAVKDFVKNEAGGFQCYWDPTHVVYSHFGMGHTLTKIFGLKTIYWFVENITTGKLDRLTPVKDDDLLMLGGDIIFDNATGEVAYRFVSEDSAIERPDIKSVLSSIKN